MNKNIVLLLSFIILVQIKVTGPRVVSLPTAAVRHMRSAIIVIIFQTKGHL